MSLRGDYAKLEAVRQMIRSAAAGELKNRLLAAAASEALTQVALGFRESRAPSGAAWAPLKARKGMPLRATGRLANSFTSKPTEVGFTIGTNVTYAKFHQYGTKGHHAHSQRRYSDQRGRFMSGRRVARAYDKYTKKREDAEDRGKPVPRAPVFVRRILEFQAGGGKLPARPMVPEHELGPIWSAAIKSAVDVAFKNFFSRIAK